MIEAIQVVRDVVIILCLVIITGMVVIVGIALMHLTDEIDNVGSVAAAVVSGVVHPIKRVVSGLLAISSRIRP